MDGKNERATPFNLVHGTLGFPGSVPEAERLVIPAMSRRGAGGGVDMTIRNGGLVLGVGPGVRLFVEEWERWPSHSDTNTAGGLNRSCCGTTSGPDGGWCPAAGIIVFDEQLPGTSPGPGVAGNPTGSSPSVGDGGTEAESADEEAVLARLPGPDKLFMARAMAEWVRGMAGTMQGAVERPSRLGVVELGGACTSRGPASLHSHWSCKRRGDDNGWAQDEVRADEGRGKGRVRAGKVRAGKVKRVRCKRKGETCMTLATWRELKPLALIPSRQGAAQCQA
ncbi:hypothetical protein BD779DRAFT_1472825 [Infundibulicybe gibba]|nr:hypothetical protein BD779DRAFT_1472825 [Infundibulicybe gibba]